MNAKPTGYSVNKPYDYVEAAITYTPGTYWKLDPTTCGTMASPNASNLANGTCAYGPDGLLLSRVDLRVAAGPFTVPAGRTDCAGGTSCTLAEERQNFANWFQYYRKRTLMMNAALGNAFDGLHGLRAGFFAFNDVGSSPTVTMYDFDATTGAPSTVADPTNNSTRAIGALYQDHGQDFAGTKTRPAMDYLGQQFRRDRIRCGAHHQLLPVQCRVRDHGRFRERRPRAHRRTATTTTRRDHRQPIPTTSSTAPAGPTSHPHPTRTIMSNSMADIAMKLYTENPRPDLPPIGGVSVDKSDVTPGADRNPNLHVNMYGMILNLTGRIFGNTATYAEPEQRPVHLSARLERPERRDHHQVAGRKRSTSCGTRPSTGADRCCSPARRKRPATRC